MDFYEHLILGFVLRACVASRFYHFGIPKRYDRHYYTKCRAPS